MERIAVVSVALSVGVMVLTLAVMMGFKREVSRKITGFAAHATLTDVRSVRSLSPAPVRRSGELEALIRSADGFVSGRFFGAARPPLPQRPSRGTHPKNRSL